MKEKIREIVISYGADICGFAGIERFEDAPEGFSPKDIFQGCKSVISFGVALPMGLAKIPSRLIYAHFNNISCIEADMIAFKSSKDIEKVFRCTAIPIPCDIPYEYWDGESMEGRGLISMKLTAVKAGLGSIGKSSLLLNETYGNMLTLGAILTDMEILSDNLPKKSICIDGCRKCIENCPSGAISNHSVNQKLCRMNTYGKTKRGFDTVDCNKCRAVCPMFYGNQKR